VKLIDCDILLSTTPSQSFVTCFFDRYAVGDFAEFYINKWPMLWSVKISFYCSFHDMSKNHILIDFLG